MASAAISPAVTGPVRSVSWTIRGSSEREKYFVRLYCRRGAMASGWPGVSSTIAASRLASAAPIVRIAAVLLANVLICPELPLMTFRHRNEKCANLVPFAAAHFPARSLFRAAVGTR